MSRRHKIELDIPCDREILKPKAYELQDVIRHNIIWQVEPAHYIFPDKIIYLDVSDLVKYLYFYPLDEVVCEY